MKVISTSNLPVRPPITFTLVMWLILDYTAAPGYVWGIVGTLLAIMWIAWLIFLAKHEDVDLITAQEVELKKVREVLTNLAAKK